MKSELTVAEAVVASGRSKTRIYAWMDDGSLPYEETSEGRIIKSLDVMRVAGQKRRGRPRSGQSRVPAPADHEPVVYFVRFGSRIKIGTTTRLITRLRGFPYDEILAIEPGGVERERERHDEFAEHRAPGHREWYEATPTFEALAAELRARHGDPSEFVRSISTFG